MPKDITKIKEEILNKLKQIGYEFDNYCVFVPNKEQWEKEKFQRNIWYLIIYHRFNEITYLEINFSTKSFRKYIERDNYREAMCPEEEYCEKIDVPLIDEEEEIFYQLGWIKETTKQRKEKEKRQQEQAIFKELKEIGWEYNEKPNNKMLFERYSQEYDSYDFILIHKKTKTYTGDFIDMKTHQLLHRLFEIWGFFNEKSY